MTPIPKPPRVGRKRAAGERTPSGQLSRKILDEIGAQSPTAVMRFVQSALRNCGEAAYGTPLGRLFLDGKLDAIEFEAGKRWDRLIRRYHRAIGAPFADPRSVELDQLTREREADPDSRAGEEQADIDRAVVRAFESARLAVTGYGRDAVRDMRDLCEGQGEYPRGFDALCRVRGVLDGLAGHWGLTKRRK